MGKLYRITMVVFVHVLYAFSVFGCIISLYYRQLVIALLFAAMKNCLIPMWK